MPKIRIGPPLKPAPKPKDPKPQATKAKPTKKNPPSDDPLPSDDDDLPPSPPVRLVKEKSDKKKTGIDTIADSARGPYFFPDPAESDPEPDPNDDEDFQTFVRKLNRTSKRNVVESASEEVDEDDEEDFDDDEDDDGRRYVKEEGKHQYYSQQRGYQPQRGNRKNNPRCVRCIQRNFACYMQDSNKARGACYECGRGKQKCFFFGA